MKDSPNSPEAPLARSVVKDRRLFWLAVLALMGLLICQYGYQKAFPAASLDFSKSRAEIQDIAAVWAKKIGYQPKNVFNKTEIVATTFTEKADHKAFLEQELGQERANQLMRETVPVYLWKARFCREHQFEQCFIALTPDGQFNGFIHEYRNDFALKSLSRDDAEKLARDFLAQIVGISVDGVNGSPGKYTLIRDETRTQINRQDYIFVWEDQTQSIKDAYLDIEIHVSGDKITFMDKYLHVPQDWQRKYLSMRSYNEQLYNVALFFWFVLSAAAVFTFLFATTHHKIRWKFTILTAVIFALVMLADMLNSTENAIFTYSCQTDFQTFLMQYWLTCATNSLYWFVAAVILVGAAEYLYRTYFPDKVAAEHWFTIKGLRHPQVLANLVCGHLAACIYIAWIIVYYLIGQKVGFWTPLQVQNAGVYSGWLPPIGGLHVGVLASGHEELLYRIIAFTTIAIVLRRLAFFKEKKLLTFWLANFIQAACWGFMHSLYPQQPAYARGLELTVNGMFFGWLNAQVGILACLIGHYLVDVVIVLRPLLESGHLAWIIPTIIVCVPFVVAIVVSVLSGRKGSQNVDDLSNQSLTASLPQLTSTVESISAPFEYQRLAAGNRLILVVLSAAFIAGTLIFRHGDIVGEGSRIRINREQALAIGRQSVNARRLDMTDYQASAQIFTTLSMPVQQSEMQYVFENTSSIKAAELANLVEFGYIYNVRFFKPGSSREYTVHIDGHGHEIGFDVIDVETAPGARLDLGAAKDMARDYIERRAPFVMPFNFASVSTFKRANRTDYQLAFITPQLKVGDAPFKTTIDIIGDQTSGLNSGWLVPDRWRDEREHKDLPEELAAISHALCPIIAGIFAALWAIGLVRTGALRWRLSVIAGLAVGACSLATYLNSMPWALHNMPTTTTFDRYALQQLTIWLRLVGMEIGKDVLLGVLSFAVFRIVSPDADLVRVCHLTFCRQQESKLRERQRQLWIDAVLIGLWCATARWFIYTIGITFSSLVSPNICEAALGFVVPNLNSAVPGLNMFMEMMMKAWGELAFAAVLTGLYLKYVRKQTVFALVLILGALIYGLDLPYPNTVDYVIGVGRNCILGFVFYVFIAKLAKRNILAYILCGVFVTALFKLPLYLVHSPRVSVVDVSVSSLGLLLPLIALLYFMLSRRAKSENL